MVRREGCQYGGVMVARYEGSLSGQGRSVTPLHWYLGQGNREGRESEKKANEVMQLLKWRVGGMKDGRMESACWSVPSRLH